MAQVSNLLLRYVIAAIDTIAGYGFRFYIVVLINQNTIARMNSRAKS